MDFCLICLCFLKTWGFRPETPFQTWQTQTGRNCHALLQEILFSVEVYIRTSWVRRLSHCLIPNFGVIHVFPPKKNGMILSQMYMSEARFSYVPSFFPDFCSHHRRLPCTFNGCQDAQDDDCLPPFVEGRGQVFTIPKRSKKGTRRIARCFSVFFKI